MMIKGNAFDTFTISFADGQQFSLMATSAKIAEMFAQRLHQSSIVIKVIKNDD